MFPKINLVAAFGSILTQGREKSFLRERISPLSRLLPAESFTSSRSSDPENVI
jgi:hypothetical protein